MQPEYLLFVMFDWLFIIYKTGGGAAKEMEVLLEVSGFDMDGKFEEDHGSSAHQHPEM